SEWLERLAETCRMICVEDFFGKGGESRFIPLIGIGPAGLLFAFARRLERIGLHALHEGRVNARERPSAEQGLVEHVFVCTREAAFSAQMRVETAPSRGCLPPFVRKFRQGENAYACIFAALGVV